MILVHVSISHTSESSVAWDLDRYMKLHSLVVGRAARSKAAGRKPWKANMCHGAQVMTSP